MCDHTPTFVFKKGGTFPNRKSLCREDKTQAINTEARGVYTFSLVILVFLNLARVVSNSNYSS